MTDKLFARFTAILALSMLVIVGGNVARYLLSDQEVGRLPSGDGTALSSASPIEPAPQSRPSGLQSHIAGEQP